MKNLKKEQIKLAKKVILKDKFKDINLIAGIDRAYTDKKIIVSIVIIDKNCKFIESKTSINDLTFPYIPGFLAYREITPILETFSTLENTPDLIMIEGNGILHPRKFGLASHLGLSLDIPTIGIAKKLTKPAELKNKKCLIDNKILGEEVLTRKESNPVYISPGHKITLKSSIKFVKKFIRENHKLPEPIHLAHKLVKKTKRDLK